MLNVLILEVKSRKDKEKAVILSRFFKTQKGEYGEGDIFLGITVPIQRMIAKKFKDLPLSDIEKLLQSKIHEHRLIALFILILKYKKADSKNQDKIIKIYLKNLNFVNNWDLVDSSAPYLLGAYLLNRKKDLLYKLAKSKDLWKKRIAMMSTYAFIKNHQFIDALKIAEILIKDEHDLIHKAVGWMLREVGNRDLKAEKSFLDKYYKSMSRTMLRYALEKLNPKLKRYYLAK